MPKDKKQKDDNAKALLRQAYGQATQDLRTNHRDEFNELYAARAKELGVDWQPRMTPEQKAEAQFDELLEAYPHLRERVTESAT